MAQGNRGRLCRLGRELEKLEKQRRGGNKDCETVVTQFSTKFLMKMNLLEVTQKQRRCLLPTAAACCDSTRATYRYSPSRDLSSLSDS